MKGARKLWLIFPVLCGSAVTLPAADADWGAMHHVSIGIGLREDWYLVSRVLVSSRDDFGEYHAYTVGIGLGYRMTDTIHLRAGYRQNRTSLPGQWVREDRPYIEFAHQFDWGGIGIRNRGRMEFRKIPGVRKETRYRHQLIVEAPWKLTRLQLQPYLEEELFYSLDQDRVAMNWMSAGIAWKVSAHLKLRLAYRWVTQRAGSSWIHRHNLVTGLSWFY